MLHCSDFLDNDLPDQSFDLIIADPPYFRVRGEFDFVWDSFDNYLLDVQRWGQECQRLLSPSGTLFWWGNPRTIAHTQVLLDSYFSIVNALVWEKTNHPNWFTPIKNVRSFYTLSESLLMYESLSQKSIPRRTILDDPRHFMSLKIMFDQWHKDTGMSLKEVCARVGHSAGHWLGYSAPESRKKPKIQFMFPTLSRWNKMMDIAPLPMSYQDALEFFRQERNEERVENFYIKKRRFFSLEEKVGTVLRFPTSSEGPRYPHPTKKSRHLTKLLVEATTRPGDAVLIPFAGSGTECAVASKLGRSFVGYEIDPVSHQVACDRIRDQGVP